MHKRGNISLKETLSRAGISHSGSANVTPVINSPLSSRRLNKTFGDKVKRTIYGVYNKKDAQTRKKQVNKNHRRIEEEIELTQSYSSCDDSSCSEDRVKRAIERNQKMQMKHLELKKEETMRK